MTSWRQCVFCISTNVPVIFQIDQRQDCENALTFLFHCQLDVFNLQPSRPFSALVDIAIFLLLKHCFSFSFFGSEDGKLIECVQHYSTVELEGQRLNAARTARAELYAHHAPLQSVAVKLCLPSALSLFQNLSANDTQRRRKSWFAHCLCLLLTLAQLIWSFHLVSLTVSHLSSLSLLEWAAIKVGTASVCVRR